jgi:hypothetical protein
MLTFTTPEREALFAYQPPRSWSAVRIFFVVLIVAGVGALIWEGVRRYRGGQRDRWTPLKFFFLVFASVWLFFDLRMGLEFLVDTEHDLSTYAFAPAGNKNFRTYGQFNEIVNASLPYLENEPTFAFLGPDPTFLSIVRYFSFPSIPARPGDSLERVRIWVIFERPDITVDSNGRLLVNTTTVLSSAGTVLKEFKPGTFIYRTGL